MVTRLTSVEKKSKTENAHPDRELDPVDWYRLILLTQKKGKKKKKKRGKRKRKKKKKKEKKKEIAKKKSKKKKKKKKVPGKTSAWTLLVAHECSTSFEPLFQRECSSGQQLVLMYARAPGIGTGR